MNTSAERTAGASGGQRDVRSHKIIVVMSSGTEPCIHTTPVLYCTGLYYVLIGAMFFVLLWIPARSG